MFLGLPNYSPRPGPLIWGNPRAPHAQEAWRTQAQQPLLPPPHPQCSQLSLPAVSSTRPTWSPHLVLPPGHLGSLPAQASYLAPPHSRTASVHLLLRARGRQPQEPSVFRRFQEELALHHLSEAGALHDRLGPRGRADGPRLLQDN